MRVGEPPSRGCSQSRGVLADTIQTAIRRKGLIFSDILEKFLCGRKAYGSTVDCCYKR